MLLLIGSWFGLISRIIHLKTGAIFLSQSLSVAIEVGWLVSNSRNQVVIPKAATCVKVTIPPQYRYILLDQFTCCVQCNLLFPPFLKDEILTNCEQHHQVYAWAKLQNTGPLISISLDNKTACYCLVSFFNSFWLIYMYWTTWPWIHFSLQKVQPKIRWPSVTFGGQRATVLLNRK